VCLCVRRVCVAECVYVVVFFEMFGIVFVVCVCYVYVHALAAVVCL